MNVRLHALNFWLRLTVKRALLRMEHATELRAQLARDAARYFVVPEGAHFVADLIRRPERSRGGTQMTAVWASRGRPDRRKVMLYLHGGAYIAGSPETHRHLAAALAGVAGVRAVLPDYALAPEDPFPAALEDALASYRHLLDAGYAAAEIALAGDSAGGGLCFCLLLEIAAAGLPRPACVVAFSPWVDMTGEAASLRRNASRDVMLPARRLADVVTLYLGAADPRDPRASPVFGVWVDPPPALIMASRSEILVDDAANIAQCLRAAGGNVQLEMWRGLPHAWPIFTSTLREADHAITNAGAFIARQLEVDPSLSVSL